MSVDISYEDVVAAVARLAKENRRPTIAEVRHVLGDRGSVTDIAKHLKEWKSQSSLHSQAKSEVYSQQQDLFIPQPSVQSHDAMDVDQKKSGLFRSKMSKSPVTKDPSSKLDQQDLDVHVHVHERESENKIKSNINSNSEQQAVDGAGRLGSASGSGRASAVQVGQVRKAVDKNRPVNKFAQKEGFKEDYLTAQVDFKPLSTLDLAQLDKKDLIIMVRKLQSILTRENNRTETAEKLSREANNYAQELKEQVGLRINELKESMSVQIVQLQNQMQEFKQQAGEDLNYYRKQLEKASAKLSS